MAGDRAAVIDGILSANQMEIIGGKTVNRGVIEFKNTSSSSLASLTTTDNMINDGKIHGNCIIEVRTLLNNKLIDGNLIGIYGDILENIEHIKCWQF
jgi:N-acetylmuramic acid 6-phosphate (MurNAc-6-P) etherase